MCHRENNRACCIMKGAGASRPRSGGFSYRIPGAKPQSVSPVRRMAETAWVLQKVLSNSPLIMSRERLPTASKTLAEPSKISTDRREALWRLASAMEGLAAWLKAEASLHTPKRFAQIRPLISQIAVNGRDEQSFLSSPGLPAFGIKRCDEPLFVALPSGRPNRWGWVNIERREGRATNRI